MMAERDNNTGLFMAMRRLSHTSRGRDNALAKPECKFTDSDLITNRWMAFARRKISNATLTQFGCWVVFFFCGPADLFQLASALLCENIAGRKRLSCATNL
jgi:hypothetical protein